MNDTPNLNMPYISAAQAQKHVTHNEALRALDAIVHLSVLDRDLLAPPLSPVDGDRYLVAASATGIWAGRDAQIAAWQDNAWLFYGPQVGWLAWVSDEDKLLTWNGTAWAQAFGNAVNPAALVGVNTTASDPDKLAVKSNSILFSHDDVTPGTGDIQTKLNKAAALNTASFLFQDNWSGRAEIGLTGDDDFHFKVSPDGASWNESLIINKDDGLAVWPQNSFNENLMYNMLPDGGRFAGAPEPKGIIASAFVSPSYMMPYNSSVFSSYGKNTYDSTSYGGASAAQDSEIIDLITRFTSSDYYRRYTIETHVMKITAGAGTAYAYSIDGTNYYLTFTNSGAPRWVRSSWGMNYRVLSGAVYIAPPAATEIYVDGIKQAGDLVITAADGWKQVLYICTGDPKSFSGFDSVMFRCCATPGTEILCALPFLLPSQITPHVDEVHGIIPTMEAWQ